MDRKAYEQMAATQATHWWFVARRKVLRRVVASLRLPRGADILEVGCGSGGNLPMLQEFGSVRGVEHDAWSREYAQRSTGVDVRHGLLPDELPFEGQRFDLICMFDVLEHVEDDLAALAALAGRVKPGGRLLVAVPAYGWLFSSHDRLHHHHRRYTAGDLSAKAKAAGWRSLRQGYFNTLLFPLAAAKRLLERGLGRDMGDDSVTPGVMVNATLQAVFSCEAVWVPVALMPFGLSALGVFATEGSDV